MQQENPYAAPNAEPEVIDQDSTLNRALVRIFAWVLCMISNPIFIAIDEEYHILSAWTAGISIFTMMALGIWSILTFPAPYILRVLAMAGSVILWLFILMVTLMAFE